MNQIDLVTLAPYITFISAILVAFLTYQSQLRLKSFEMLLKRREEVLSDMEKYIQRLYSIKHELSLKENSEKPNWEIFSRVFFHDSHILYHKIKGANFAATNYNKSTTFKILLDNFRMISNEPIGKEMSKETIDSWIHRTLNILTSLYGFSHSNLNSEIEFISMTIPSRISRRSKLYLRSCIKWVKLLWLKRKKNNVNRKGAAEL